MDNLYRCCPNARTLDTIHVEIAVSPLYWDPGPRVTIMTRRIRLCWTELPGRALRDGLACQAGGARVMLLPAECRKADEPSSDPKPGAEPDAEPQPAGRPR